jgi:(p)ppGpp synthase/HD superfamily hydrolase
MVSIKIIDKARIFAKIAHSFQHDDSGALYFDAHLEPVAKAIINFTTDYEVIAAAYLHDIFEDTDTSPGELRKEFGDRVTDLVLELTHRGSPDEMGYYFPLLKSKEAIMIKLVDRANNVSRMQSWPEKRQAHYLKHSKFWRNEEDIK